jgi:putative CocE/NonD family hydrolase
MTTRVSQFNQYRGYSRAIYDGYVRRSDYLPRSDGIKLAYDLLLPARNRVPAQDPLPVLLMHTTYLRAVKLVEDGELLLDGLSPLSWMAKTFLRLRARFAKDGQIGDIVFRESWLKGLLDHGYAIVVVERSGTGASSGGMYASFEEVAQEADEILNWIAAQPWCDGNIGMIGTSMVAMAQYAAASTGNPHLKAIFPCAGGFDMYSSVIFPGGVYCTGFANVLFGSTGMLEKMIVPVDSDTGGAQLAEILKERGERTLSEVTTRNLSRAPFRDSPNPHPRGNKLWEDQGLYTLLDRINRSGVAVYNSVGWFDLFARDGLLWHANLTVPHRLHIRPLFHSAMGESRRDLDFTAEVHRWFDYWLKGIDNGIVDEPPIHYYVMRPRDSSVWRTSHQWPLPSQQMRRFYLAEGKSGSVDSVNDGTLRLRPPEDPAGFEAYTIDYTTTTGPDARWSAVLKGGRYPLLGANDQKGLTYTTPPLDSAVEITGHPVVHLWIATQAPDVDLFAYLQEVPPDGRAWYVSEGNLRASHRLLNEAPFDNLGLPYHRSYEEDVMPIPAGEPVELVFDLLPTSKIFRRGNRIRLTITCADADNFETPALDPPPEIHVLREASHASFVELPIIPAR